MSESALISAFSVPPMMLGPAPEPRSHFERGAHLVIHAEAAGDVTTVLGNPDALAYYRWRMERLLGI